MLATPQPRSAPVKQPSRIELIERRLAEVERRLGIPNGYDWPLVPIERHICTMAAARANALPGALEEKAAAALQLPHQKDAPKDGK
jgi:hypothetical protein